MKKLFRAAVRENNRTPRKTGRNESSRDEFVVSCSRENSNYNQKHSRRGFFFGLILFCLICVEVGRGELSDSAFRRF